MYSVAMFTDDVEAQAVGIPRTKRAIRTMRQLTLDINLLMAKPEKRTLGSWCATPHLCSVIAAERHTRIASLIAC
jgi:hypothetical protein